MPTAPTYGPQRANIAAVPGVRQDANRTPQEYGAGFGQNIQQFGSLMEQVHAERKRVEAQNSSAMFGLEVDALAKEVQQKFPGIKATDGRVYYNEKLAEIESKHRPQDPLAQQKFDEAATITKGRYANEMGAWGTTQAIETANAADDAEFVLERDNAVRLAPVTGDPVAKMLGDTAYSKALQARQRKLERMGMPKESIDANLAAARNEIHSQVVNDYISRGDFAGAKTWFDKYKHTLAPKSESELDSKINDGYAFTKANAVVQDVFNKYLVKAENQFARLPYEQMMQEIATDPSLPEKARDDALRVFSQRRTRHDEAIKTAIEDGYKRARAVIDAAREGHNTGNVSGSFAAWKTQNRVIWDNLSDTQRDNLEKSAAQEAPIVTDGKVFAAAMEMARCGQNFWDVEGATTKLSKDHITLLERVKTARGSAEDQAWQSAKRVIEMMKGSGVSDSKADKMIPSLYTKMLNDKTMTDAGVLYKWAMDNKGETRIVYDIQLDDMDVARARTIKAAEDGVDSSIEAAESLFRNATPWSKLTVRQTNPKVDELMSYLVASSGKSWPELQNAAMRLDARNTPRTALERDRVAWNLAVELMKKPTDLGIKSVAGSPYTREEVRNIAEGLGGVVPKSVDTGPYVADPEQRQQIKNLEARLAAQRSRPATTKPKQSARQQNSNSADNGGNDGLPEDADYAAFRKQERERVMSELEEKDREAARERARAYFDKEFFNSRGEFVDRRDARRDIVEHLEKIQAKWKDDVTYTAYADELARLLTEARRAGNSF